MNRDPHDGVARKPVSFTVVNEVVASDRGAGDVDNGNGYAQSVGAVHQRPLLPRSKRYSSSS